MHFDYTAHVKQALEVAPREIEQTFSNLLRDLEVGGPTPDNPTLSIEPLEDDTRPNAFTVSYGTMLVAYQVMMDHPQVRFFHITWT